MSIAPSTSTHSPNRKPETGNTPSARQLANRSNAQKSTGPVTQEGKARSSQNARKHGFLSGIMPWDAVGWRTMLEGLYRSLKPANEIEQLIVDQIGIAYLRLSRLYVHEANVDQHAFVYNLLLPNLPKPSVIPSRRLSRSAYQYVRDPGPAGDAEAFQAGFLPSNIPDMPAPEPKKRYFEDDRAHLRMRYETMLTRQITRSMTLLDKMQKERKEEEAKGVREEAPFLPAFYITPYNPDDAAEMKAAQEAVQKAQEQAAGERAAALDAQLSAERAKQEAKELEAVAQPSVPSASTVGQASVPVCESKEDPTPTASVPSVPDVPDVPLVPNVPSKQTKAKNRALLAQIRNQRRQHTLSREKRACAA